MSELTPRQHLMLDRTDAIKRIREVVPTPERCSDCRMYGLREFKLGTAVAKSETTLEEATAMMVSDNQQCGGAQYNPYIADASPDCDLELQRQRNERTCW